MLPEEYILVTFLKCWMYIFLYHYLWQLCNPVIDFSSTRQWGYCTVRKMQLESHTSCVSCCIHCPVEVKQRIYGRCAQNKAEFLPARHVNFHMKLIKKSSGPVKNLWTLDIKIERTVIPGHSLFWTLSNFQNFIDHYRYKIGKYCAYLTVDVVTTLILRRE